MKKQFPGYFTPSEEHFKELWEDATFVLDTNVLLQLLRLGVSARNEILKVLESLKDRIWIPHQVAKEFSKNWRGIEDQNETAINTTCKKMLELTSEFENLLNNLKRHNIVSTDSLLQETKTHFENIVEKIKQSSSLPKKGEVEDLLDRVFSIIEDNIGPEPDEKTLKDWQSEGEERYKNKTPPGYEDANKDTNKFGDLILWKQIISYSKKSNKSIIFISEDRKKDWMQIINGKTIGPRPELINEFIKETGMNFYSYQLETFLGRASKSHMMKISTETIEEVIANSIEEKQNDENEDNIHKYNKMKLVDALDNNLKLKNANDVFFRKYFKDKNDHQFSIFDPINRNLITQITITKKDGRKDDFDKIDADLISDYLDQLDLDYDLFFNERVISISFKKVLPSFIGETIHNNLKIIMPEINVASY